MSKTIFLDNRKCVTKFNVNGEKVKFTGNTVKKYLTKM